MGVWCGHDNDEAPAGVAARRASLGERHAHPRTPRAWIGRWQDRCEGDAMKISTSRDSANESLTCILSSVLSKKSASIIHTISIAALVTLVPGNGVTAKECATPSRTIDSKYSTIVNNAIAALRVRVNTRAILDYSEIKNIDDLTNKHPSCCCIYPVPTHQGQSKKNTWNVDIELPCPSNRNKTTSMSAWVYGNDGWFGSPGSWIETWLPDRCD
jgi:hypothetical protein